MNAPSTIPLSGALDPYSVATTAINAWRGQCLELFSRGEAAIVQALVQRHAHVPLMLGDRIRALAAALQEKPLPQAAAAIDAFRAHVPLRNFLCHGTTRVSLSRSGRWMASITMPGETSVMRRAIILVSENEAVVLLDAIRAEVGALQRALMS